MPGVQRTNRCQRCKRMKIKCDEKIPGCTPCMRAQASCSYPPATIKFVHHVRHVDEAIASGLEISRNKLEHVLSNIDTHNAPDGASFARFRWTSDEPRRLPTTVADRVAARLVHLADKDFERDILTSVGYLKHLPARLSENSALRDCVALLCSAWCNLRRGLSSKQVVDLKLYGKALRSLHNALDSSERLTCETLAAVTVIERFEVIFDSGRPFHRARHSHGLQSMMRSKGPPKLNDELDIQLAFENHASLLSFWVVEGGDNFYLSSPWKETMNEAMKLVMIHKDGKTVTRLAVYTAQKRALLLRDQVMNLDSKTKTIGEPILQKARNKGHITEEPDPDSPINMKVHFASIDKMQFFISHVMLRIILNRMIHHLNIFLGETDMFLDVEHWGLCREMWKCIPFIRGLGLVASMLSSAPMYLSYEGATENETEYLLDFIIQAAEYKGRLPKDRNTVHVFVLNTARAMIGRMGFEESVKPLEKQDS